MSKLSETRRHISGLDMTDAQRELHDLRAQLFHLRMQQARGEVKNNRQFQQIRADIARLMFRISELNREGRRGGRALESEDASELPEAETPATTTGE